MRELKFIHISKTGGTSIEDCAKKKNIEFVPGTIRVDPKFVERKEVKGFRK